MGQGCPLKPIVTATTSTSYLEETNIVIWQRVLPDAITNSVDTFLKSNPNFQLSMTVTPKSVLSSVSESLNDPAQLELSENIAELVDMFCCLFELRINNFSYATNRTKNNELLSSRAST